MSSIGERLREERLRLGLSQADFAAIAGASKSGMIKWEKDESAPTAKALADWAKAGVDVAYVVTGHQSGAASSSIKSWNALDELGLSSAVSGAQILDAVIGPKSRGKSFERLAADVKAELDEIELWLETNKRSAESDRNERRERLEHIAAMPSLSSHASLKLRVYDLLRWHFSDGSASKRRQEHYSALSEIVERASRDLDDVLEALGLTLDGATEQALLTLMVDYRIQAEDLVQFISAMSRVKRVVLPRDRAATD